MDFNKLQGLVNRGITLDLENADIHELRVCFEMNAEKHWIEFTPEKYKGEEELAATINTSVERKKSGKINTNVNQ